MCVLFLNNLREMIDWDIESVIFHTDNIKKIHKVLQLAVSLFNLLIQKSNPQNTIFFFF